MIDAHHHIWDLAVRPQEWIDPDRMAPIHRSFALADLAGPAAAAGVDATVLVQTVAVAAETPEFLAAANGSDLVAGVVGWVDLTSPAVEEHLAQLGTLPGGDRLVGVRHLVQSEPDPQWLCRPDVRRGLAAVSRAGLVYDLLVLPHQLPAATQTVQALPELRFVLDHLAKPPIAAGLREPWAAELAALAAAPNVAAKLSGLVTEADWARWTPAQLAPYVDEALAAFGPRRLMFGSDWPVSLLATSYERWADTARQLTAALSPDEQASVYAGCAREWYRLP